jgi:hypothetical protein
MGAGVRFALLIVAAVACTNAVAPGPGPGPGPRLPWPLALLAFVLWLVASSVAVFPPRRRLGDI